MQWDDSNNAKTYPLHVFTNEPKVNVTVKKRREFEGTKRAYKNYNVNVFQPLAIRCFRINDITCRNLKIFHPRDSTYLSF